MAKYIDLDFSNGDLTDKFATDEEVVRNSVYITLKSFNGDNYHDPSFGIPVGLITDDNSEDVITLGLIQVANSVEGVSDAQSFLPLFDKKTGVYTCPITITTIFNTTEVITLGQ